MTRVEGTSTSQPDDSPTTILPRIQDVYHDLSLSGRGFPELLSAEALNTAESQSAPSDTAAASDTAAEADTAAESDATTVMRRISPADLTATDIFDVLVPDQDHQPPEQGHSDQAPPASEPDAKANLVRDVQRGALWSALNTLVMKFANIAIMAYVVREVTPRDFGVFAVAITVHTVISSFAELGVTSCLMRADVDADAIAPTVATLSLISSAMLAGVMVVFAEPLSAALGSRDAAEPMRVLALAVLMVGIFAVPAAEVQRHFRQDQQFWATIIGFVPANALLVLLAMHGSGAMSFAWSRVVGQLLTGLALAYWAPRRVRPGYSRQQARFLLSFGIPLAGANLLNYILLNADYALVGRLLGAVELGTYMLAFNVASWSTSLLSAMVNGVAMTAFSHVKDDAQRMQRALIKATSAIAYIALPICGLTFALAPQLIDTVYGGQWHGAAAVLTILSFYGAISVFCLLIANLLSSLGHTRALLLVQVAWLSALVPLMAVGVHWGGIVGAGWAHIVIVTLVALPVYLLMLKRSSSIALLPLLPAVLAPLIAAVFAAVAAYGVAHLINPEALALLAGGIVGSTVYGLIALPGLLPLAMSSGKLPAAILRPALAYVAAVRKVTARVTVSRSGANGRHLFD